MAGWAWDTSLAASILIAIVFLFRFALRKSAPPALMHLLGLVILVRLLLPAAPPSQVSVFNLVPQELREVPLNVPIPIPMPPSEPLKHSISSRELLPIFWALGAVLILARVFQQHWCIRNWVKRGRSISHQALEEARLLHGLKRTPALKIVPQLQIPALYGFFRPTVLLPDRPFDNHQLKLIFLHELAHIRRRHVVINWLVIITQTLHWFNPLVWLAMRRLRADQELICDRNVMRLIGQAQSRAYGETLLALASNQAQSFSTALSISTNFKQMKERIRMLTQFRPTTRRLVFAGAILLVLSSVATFTSAVDRTKSAKVPKNAEIEKARSREDSLRPLNEELSRQNESVMRSEKELDQLRAELGIIGDPPNSEALSSLHVEKIRALWAEVTRLEAKIRERDQTVRSFGPIAAESDPVIARLTLEKEKSERDLVRLEVDHSNDHPEVKAARNVHKRLQAQMEERYEALRKSMKVSVDNDVQALDRLRQTLRETENEYRHFVERSRPYFQARRDLETKAKIRDSVYIRLLQEKVDGQIPRP